MIVVDTNVLSEPLRREPDRRVLEWLARNATQIALTTITVAELRYGAMRLPEGTRRTALLLAVDRLVAEAGDRVCSFDVEAARAYASIRSEREARGTSISVEDTMIAAICLARGYALATSNVGDFDDVGLSLVDPWA
ncbi:MULTISPECIES: type II toxin-antitoxin system VapC family toxin [unclassified Pseudoclavibacter]|uniref:type II toxin-antitoxin system VapC family toxin n=1 Tax=unclassified Pseudoclavibacter TaxID=2615177 RepID=UPI001BA6934A|nr:type II toxin-antitoxin system VapC family toxin [Pseudoclavibacter sp. Marseille-Q4354]MBS3179128.1 type II toxin-antitoxin system VapC family toxin [Pseudoclavibacter sp. Marseille-Q4354]